MTVDDIWISVNNMLPRQHERVLVVCYNTQNHMDRHVSISTFYGVDRETGRYMWSGNKHVSHWADIPEMPPETNDFKRGIRLSEIYNLGVSK